MNILSMARSMIPTVEDMGNTVCRDCMTVLPPSFDGDRCPNCGKRLEVDE